MAEQSESQGSLPEDDLIFRANSVDDSLTMIIRRDTEPETPLMRDLGAMGTLKIYNTSSGELYHEERLALSASAIFGPGPNDDEVKRWANIMSRFADQ